MPTDKSARGVSLPGLGVTSNEAAEDCVDTAGECGEPESARARQPSRLIELETSHSKTEGGGIDWAPWERDYRAKLGIELTDADKLEIRSTVPAFFCLLRKLDFREKTR